MLDQQLSPDPTKERRQLIVLALGLGLIGSVLWWLKGGLVPMVLIGGALLAATGAAAYGLIGRNVFLLYAVVGLMIGRVISWLMIRAIYGLAILGFGSLFRLFGMDHLNKRFQVCRARESMLDEAPGTDRESFGRQS